MLVACTASEPEPSPPAPGTPSPEGPGGEAPSLVLAVVASLTGPTAGSDATFLEGMQLAERELSEAGGVAGQDLRLELADDRGHPARARVVISRLLRRGGAPAVVVVGPSGPVAGLRRRAEAAGDPVFLLGGDLYSSRALYRQVFQTSVPVLWQARVMARYLARDRRYERVVLVTEGGPGELAAREAFAAAMAEEGASTAMELSLGPGEAPGRVARRAEGSGGVAFLGSAETAARLAQALRQLSHPPQLVAPTDALSPPFAQVAPEPGTVAPYVYSWAGWARPIPRVERFRRRFRSEFGHLPAGMEQEGYDAVRALAAALERTGGAGGARLVRALEELPTRAFSSLPVELGPDDHTFVGQHEVGLFAVPGPAERVERWVGPDAPWRPIMRTFSSDGERTSILDRDRRVFFPFWRRNRPGPNYWRSRYGIVTRPRDPLH